MQHLLGSTQVLIIGALLLVIVASLPALPALLGRARWFSVPVCFAALFVASTLVWHAFDRSPVAVDALPSKMMRYAAAALQEPKEPNVVLIDGGSYALNAVDASIVAEELERLGYRAKVVRLAVSGSNHFERYRMQQAIVQRLNGRTSARQRWLYLAEVHYAYDRSPLAQFGSNQDTNRTYEYTTLENSWNVLRALESPGVHLPFDGAYRWPLFRHTMVNALSIGAFERYVAEDSIDVGWGHVGDARPIRRFKGLRSLIQLARQPQIEPNRLPWLKDVRERRTRRLWRRYLTNFAYFGIPSPRLEQLSYVRQFCAATDGPCICPDADLLMALDDAKYWRDESHMRAPGARIYSRWLAERLATLGILRKK